MKGSEAAGTALAASLGQDGQSPIAASRDGGARRDLRRPSAMCHIARARPSIATSFEVLWSGLVGEPIKTRCHILRL